MVDKWLDGLDAVIAKAEERQNTLEGGIAAVAGITTEQQENLIRDVTEIHDKTQQKTEEKASVLQDEIAELELALEVVQRDIEHWKKTHDEDLENGYAGLAKIDNDIIAERTESEKAIETMLAKAGKGEALSSVELATLDKLYDNVAGYPYAKDWKAFREQGQNQQEQTQEVKEKVAKKPLPSNPVADPKNVIKADTNYASMLQTHKQELSAMKPVATISTTAEFHRENRSEPDKQLLQEFKDSGLIANRKGVGKIGLSEKSIEVIALTGGNKTSYRNAAIALKSAKAVLKDGVEVGRSRARNIDGIEFDIITYAAPVTFGEEQMNVAVSICDASEYENGTVYCNKIALENGAEYNLSAAFNIDPLYLEESAWKDGSIYDYDFLVKQNPTQVVEVEDDVPMISGTHNVDTDAVVSIGMENAKENGRMYKDVCLVENSYSGKEIRVTNSALKHGLGGSGKRIISNAKAAERAGEIIKNSIPINGLKNQSNAEATYAMAGVMRDSKRTFVVITTVEKRSNQVSDMKTYDLAHAMNTRIKNESAAGIFHPQGVTPSTTLEYSIQDFLQLVNNTHKSILSESVLMALGETRPENGTYTGEVLYSLDKDFLRETVNAIDKTPLEKNLEKLEKVHNLKGAGLWLLEPSRIFDAVAGGDKVLFPACAG